MKTSQWTWTLLLIVTIALAGCSPQPSKKPPGAMPVDAGGTPQPTLPPSSPGKTIVADGQLASPYPSLALAFGGGVSGRVLTITTQAGDVVQAGDSLAVLDDTDLQRAVDDAQLALDRTIADREQALQQWERDVADAEQSLAEAERALTTARLEFSDTSREETRTNLEMAQKAEHDREWEYNEALRAWPPLPTDRYYDSWQRAIRDRELAEMRMVDAEDSHSANYLNLDTREDDVTTAERKLAALAGGIEPTYQRAIEDAERELAKTLTALTHVHLVAPWGAIVLSVDIAPEADVGAGTPVVTLLNIENGLRFVTQNLSEQHIADIYPSQRAVVTLRTFAETPLEGTVEAVVPQIEVTADTDARFTIHVRLDPTDLRLMPGLTGRMEILTED